MAVAPHLLVCQSGSGARAPVGHQPSVHALAGHAEHTGDVGSGAAFIEFQDGQGAAIEAEVLGLLQLASKMVPLLIGYL